MSGSRAAKRKKIQNPALSFKDEEIKENRKILSAISEPRWFSTLSFAVAGLCAGLFTGFNHFPGVSSYDGLTQTMLLGAYLGDPKLDLLNGVMMGFFGLIVGGCLGFSALSDHKDMGLSILLSTVLTVLVVVFTGNYALAGGAFLLGHYPAYNAYRRMQA